MYTNTPATSYSMIFSPKRDLVPTHILIFYIPSERMPQGISGPINVTQVTKAVCQKEQKVQLKRLSLQTCMPQGTIGPIQVT